MQALAEFIVRFANGRGSSEFTLADVYSFSGELEQRFPDNQHIREKVRQVLQRMRDDGLIRFLGRGHYTLDLESDDLEGGWMENGGLERDGTQNEPVRPLPPGSTVPAIRSTSRLVHLRNTLLAAEVKRLYGRLCQVCRTPVTLAANRLYAEAHHLRPLGTPHEGPDVPDNILVLCPNCHILFDRGAATAVPDTLEVRHRVPRALARAGEQLYLEAGHLNDRSFLVYHHEHVYRG